MRHLIASPRQLPLPSLEPYEQPASWRRWPTLRPFPMPLEWQGGNALLLRDCDRSLYDDPDRAVRGLPPPLRLYAGVSDPAWNRWPTLAGPYVCVSPIHGKGRNQTMNSVALNPEARVLLDSGPFSEAMWFEDLCPARGTYAERLARSRLSCGEALDRQYRHMQKYGYGSQVEALASYDLLISDHCLLDPNSPSWRRVRRQWSEQDVAFALDETVRAAAFLDAHRNGFACALNIQGVTPEDYLESAQRILPYLRPGDIIGIGGWCLTGRKPKQLLPVFRATMSLLIPFFAREQVKRIHLWGMCYATALGELLWLADQFGIEVSTDSAMPALRPNNGEWGYADWIDPGYGARFTDIHLPPEYGEEALLAFDEADDDIMAMRYLLAHDEEHADGLLCNEHLGWMLDEEVIERYWQGVLASVRGAMSGTYSSVKAYDGSWVRVLQARGPHRIEHVFQVRAWLAHLHQTHWYRPSPQDG